MSPHREAAHCDTSACDNVDGMPGDHAAREPADFDAFFAAEQRDLLRFCWGLTLDRHEAHDVAQEAMTRLYADWETVGAGNPAGWMRTVALNLVRNGWRSSQRREAALRRLEGRPGSLAQSDELSSGSTSAEVVGALRSLTDRQREAVVLHHMADWPVAEVAEAFGTSEATVKTHLQRGRAALAELLDGPGPGRHLRAGGAPAAMARAETEGDDDGN